MYKGLQIADVIRDLQAKSGLEYIQVTNTYVPS
jgi:hypothetical protein